MTEDVYVNTGPDLTKKVRYGRGEMEMEERGGREEETGDIYMIPDDQDPIYVTPEDQDPIYVIPDDQDPIYETMGQNNTAQEQLGGSEDSKQNLYLAAAVCVGLCVLLLAGIIVVVVLYGALIKEKHILQSSLDQLQNRHDNMTDQRDQWKTSYDELLSRQTNLTELKRILCESHGFTLGGDGCYYISTEKKTWEDSRAFCTARQSDLMTIKSREKQDFNRLVSGSKVVWIGLTDSKAEGVWKWVDGTPLNTTSKYWWRSEPDGGKREDCAMFINGGWYDNTCGSTFYWICEIVF